jgi:hypothetical protein
MLSLIGSASAERQVNMLLNLIGCEIPRFSGHLIRRVIVMST